MAREFAALSNGAEMQGNTAAPRWARSNRVRPELSAVRLRDFSIGAAGQPTLVCAPFALHGATIVDFAPGHSLVRTLRRSASAGYS
jgi:hypothetical protein